MGRLKIETSFFCDGGGAHKALDPGSGCNRIVVQDEGSGQAWTTS